VAHGQARPCVAQAEAKSSKSFLVLFFKKEQKKKQKTFFNLASVYGVCGLLVLGVALGGFGLRVPSRPSRLRG
jgi:hypothetical protein